MKNIKISFFIFISSVITLTVNSIYAQESLSVRPNVIVVLTTVDWLDVFIDQQPQVSLGERKNSYWCLQVAQEGDYEIELRRWPKEIDSPIAGKCSMIDRNGNIGGTALPIESASIYVGGMELHSLAEKTPYGFEGLTKEVSPDDEGIVFDVHLTPGPIYLHTFLHLAGQGKIGAYYVYVNRKKEEIK